MLQNLYKLYYRWWPLEMVSWWMEKEAVRAKVTQAPDGSHIMWMEGEKYPFPGYPRGHLLYGSLSPLKHQIKVQIFNESWAQLEAKRPDEEVIRYIQEVAYPNILKLGEQVKYDMVPVEKFCPAVKEIHRAMTKVGINKGLVDIITFILQEDDAYRFRFQWMATWFRTGLTCKAFDMLEHAEVVDDMKGKARLMKRIIMLLMRERSFKEGWKSFIQECNWDKVKLSQADKFYFRAKYFKVDYKDPATLLGRASNSVLY